MMLILCQQVAESGYVSQKISIIRYNYELEMDVFLNPYKVLIHENISHDDLLNGHVFKSYLINSKDASKTSKEYDVALHKVKRLVAKIKKFKNATRDAKHIQNFLNERFHQCIAPGNFKYYFENK